jgi:Reverse transcriptase (RNA-dependent DNA polymerase)
MHYPGRASLAVNWTLLSSMTNNINNEPYWIYKAPASDPDTLSYDEAMRDLDRDKWIEAATKEISELEQHGAWDEVPLSDAMKKITPTTWVFRRKRAPDGTLLKWKGRFCCRGDLEEQEPHEETFAPVAAWSSVRVLLTLTLIWNWKSCTVDFSNAFIQSHLDSPKWIHLPRGFQSSLPGKTCLRLKRSLYGSRVAPFLFFSLISSVMLDFGFKQSSVDPCLFFKEGMMIALFVDDQYIGYDDQKKLDELLAYFKSRDLKRTMESDLTTYLGISVKRDSKSITLTQPGLIDRILEATNMQDCRPNATPAAMTPLGSDPEGEPMAETWSYRSIVGMLLYLSTNTRPDIAFAVSQVARFSSNPKKSHATAVKTLIRYLQGTKHIGTIFSPSDELDIEVFCDADFAGLWNVEPLIDPTSAKSRLGYIIKLAKCPVIWRSALMTQIATSTMHSEYIALSQALREVIPLRRLLVEMLPIVRTFLILTNIPVMRCTVFEDNNACLTLAQTRRLTKLTRWLCTSLHHFWESVANGEVVVAPIDTTKQDADYFTKSLPKEPFLACRHRNQGA